MPSLNDPIDITKSPLELIVEKINVLNDTNLNYNDFLFSAPIPVSVSQTDVNTRVTLTPKISSQFFGVRDILYKRIDLSQLFNNDDVEITVTTETMVSEIIDQINQKYGINLTADDYLDSALPIVNPQIVNPVVVIQTNPSSYMFVGTGSLVLGPRIRPVDDSNYTRDIAVITDSNDVSFTNNLILLNTQYETASYFSLLRNTVTVSSFRVDKLLSLPNGNFYLNGSFSFEASLNGTPLQQYVVTNLIIDKNGLVISASNDQLFGSGDNDKYAINSKINFIYLADTQNLVTPAGINNLYKYQLNGQEDTTYNPSGISYTPVLIRLADDGKLYTVSPQYTAPLPSDPLITTKQIRIDRLNPNGSFDNTFSTIYIRSSSTSDVTPVLDLLTLPGGGGFVCLKPIHGLSVTGEFPIVNDINFVTGSEPTDSSFNPVFRFDQSGGLVSNFKHVFENNSPSTIMIDTVSLSENNKVLSFSQGKLLVLTNRVNPITGHISRSFLTLDVHANIINIAPDRLATDIRWLTVVKFIPFENGNSIIVGNGLRRLPNGGWSQSESLMGHYNQSGQLLYIAYKPIIQDIPVAQIYDCAVAETLVV